ncbi:MAG: hypothetical protein JWO06_1790 [Bacteroidota bacterium]|nr:hypothetical protein [Bacteroidota bacterium]
METQKIIIAALMLSLSSQLQAQRIWEERKGCVVSQGNLAPGYMFGQKSVTAYLDGDEEIFLDDRVAFTGSLWISFATSRKEQVGVKANHAVYWGAEYHFLKPSHWDPFVGLTPGAGLVRATYKSGDEIKYTPFSLVPLIAASVGCNYYVGSMFHFFVKVQGTAGQMFSTAPTPNRLDELKFMAGLGWNLRIWKPKKHDTWGKNG